MSDADCFVAYYRVSTRRQGRSGLGLEAQRQAVADFIDGNDSRLIDEFTEVESGKNDDRPELRRALDTCRLHGAVLVIAKLDRLSRDAHFLLGLQKADVRFRAVDMPEANEMVVGIMAVIAQDERRRISERTKAALRAAKARGTKLGKPENLIREGRERGAERGRVSVQRQADEFAALVRSTIEGIRAEGIFSLNGIARALNARAVPTARGRRWSATTVRNLLRRM